jgi:N-methylhydantoinase B
LLTAFLAEAPVSWRHFLKQQVFDAVAAEAQPVALKPAIADTQPAALDAQMQAIFQNLQQRYPAMMNRSH